ncbi:MAG: tRNA pseudouridine(54/55) synthase Pus10 [Promethearchaeota archaeon]
MEVLKLNIIELVKKLLSNHVICDPCLGRQFAMLGSGIDNAVRGTILRNAAILDAHSLIRDSTDDPSNAGINKNIDFLKAEGSRGCLLAKSILNLFNLEENTGSNHDNEKHLKSIDDGLGFETRSCELCGGIFSTRTREKVVEMAINYTKGIEFDTFLVGSRFPSTMMDKEDEFRVTYGLKWGESLKAHFNRFVGKILGARLLKKVEFKSPQLVILFNMTNASRYSIELLINPFFIYGRYNKYVRGIPQTHWPHRACDGKGCEECNYTGKQYQESVEELIAEPVLDFTGGKSIKFHGAGREDIDARMLGNGRPFVVEVIQGIKRNLDYAALEAAINERAGGKIKVHGLRPSSKEEMQKLKESSAKTSKKYKALCSLEAPLGDDKLQEIKHALENTLIKQKTPSRVAHRRANKTRYKKVYNLAWERIAGGENALEIYFIIEAEGGTYIKELISSDGGRTEPSISQIAGQQILCKELDVLEVKQDPES